MTLTSLDIEIFNILGFGLPPSTPTPPSPTADMIISNPGSGDYEILNIGGNAVLAGYYLGQVGTGHGRSSGLGDFKGGDTNDMLLRNTFNGAFEAYYIANNTVDAGADWHCGAEFPLPASAISRHESLSELLLRNVERRVRAVSGRGRRRAVGKRSRRHRQQFHRQGSATSPVRHHPDDDAGQFRCELGAA